MTPLTERERGQTSFQFDREPDIARDQRRLAELAGELALKAGRFGVTVSDLRLFAQTRGVLSGEEKAERMKRLNLGAVMARAGLFPSGQYRRSTVERSRRNLHVVWVIEEFKPSTQGAA